MCTKTIYFFSDKRCICKQSVIITCPKAQLPPPEQRMAMTMLPTCGEWVTVYSEIVGKCGAGQDRGSEKQ